MTICNIYRSQQYTAYIAADELVNGIGMNSTASNWMTGLNLAKNYLNTSDWHNLTNDECKRTYGKPFVSDRSGVLTVTPRLNGSDVLEIADAMVSIVEIHAKPGTTLWVVMFCLLEFDWSGWLGL